MVTYDAVAAVVAAGGATAVVLRDVLGYDRPPAPPPAPRPEPEVVDDGSMLGTIATTETDEHPLVRRVGALAVLLALTLLAAAGVGALVYRSVSALK